LRLLGRNSLAADGCELRQRLADGDQGCLSCRNIVLPDGIITRNISRVDSGEIRGLEAAGAAQAVAVEAGAVGP